LSKENSARATIPPTIAIGVNHLYGDGLDRLYVKIDGNIYTRYLTVYQIDKGCEIDETSENFMLSMDQRGSRSYRPR